MGDIKEDIKKIQIFCGLNYNEVCSKIMTKELSVNTVVKIYEEYVVEYPSLQSLPKFYYYGKGIVEYTMLHLAIYIDDLKFVDYLLQNNADVTLGTEQLAPPIFSAMGLNNLECVKKLVAVGSDVNQIVNLRFLQSDHHRYTERFNDDFSNKGQRWYHEYTPLEYAVQLNAYEIAKFLLSQGAKVGVRRENDGYESESSLAIAANTNNVKMMKLLIKYGADINSPDNTGLTPLIRAAVEDGHSAGLRFLLSQPTIEIDSLTIDKSSCLHFPGENLDFYEGIESNLCDLLDAGCDINVINRYNELAIDTYKKKQNSMYFTKCADVMKTHIVKLIAADFYVCNRNVKEVSGTEFKKLRAKCNIEVKNMKATRGPISGYSLYDMLHRSLHKLALRLQSGDDTKFDEKMRSKFPLYGGMIAYRLEKAAQRRGLFKRVENTLYEIFCRKLPATFIHEMYFYFSNAELNKLS